MSFNWKCSFKAYYLYDSLNYGLGYNSNGILTTQLPEGASYDSNKIYLYVQIVDNEGGITVFNFTAPLVVNGPSNANYVQALSDLTTKNLYSKPIIDLYSGNTVKTMQDLTVMSNMLNQQSFADKTACFGKFLLIM